MVLARHHQLEAGGQVRGQGQALWSGEAQQIGQ